MKFNSVYKLTLLLALSIGLQSAIAAPSIKHSHNGRIHSHILPNTGVKHYHKHLHDGRAHIHPYSDKLGFKHSHNINKVANPNSVKHKHSGRTHSHPLPRSGIKHPHKHKHGSRTHIHPLPVSGQKHYHRIKRKEPNKSKNNPPMITGLSIKQQIAVVLKTPLPKTVTNKPKTKIIKKPAIATTALKTSKKINIRDNKYLSLVNSETQKSIANSYRPKRTIPIMNQQTIDKVLGKHSHNGKIHQHPSPASGSKHTHNKSEKNLSSKSKKVKRQTTIKRKHLPRKVVKPVPRAIKQTPQQIAASNRQFSLALRYENGTGVAKNLPQAFNWYQRAAKQGHAKAQYRLGLLYEKGNGVEQNVSQAIRWYTTAGHNGNANAQVMLGNKYAEGSGVSRDISKAKKWYRMAANQGDMRGRANLNYLIEE